MQTLYSMNIRKKHFTLLIFVDWHISIVLERKIMITLQKYMTRENSVGRLK